MRATDERQHMVLAQAVEFDIADNDHLIVIHVKKRFIDHCNRIRAVTGQQFLKHARNPFRRFYQSLPFRVLADSFQHLRYRMLNQIHIDSAVDKQFSSLIYSSIIFIHFPATPQKGYFLK